MGRGIFYERDMDTVSCQQSEGQVDRQKVTHRLRNDREQEKSEGQSKVSIRLERGDKDRPQGRGKQGHIILRGRGTEKHYRQINVITVCVCALRARISGRKSISTTNLVHSGNRSECTLHIYSIDRPLLTA